LNYDVGNYNRHGGNMNDWIISADKASYWF